MKILIVAPSLSGSAYLIPYLYAKILGRKHDVKIIGPTFGKPIFVEDKSVKVEKVEPQIKSPVQVGMMNLVPVNLVKILKEDFDVLHCFKLLPHTAPVCAMAKKILNKPLVLTIDDYDKASPRNPLKRKILEVSEKFHKVADKKIVMSENLRRIYGGELIYQPIDIDKDKPSLKKANKLRKKLGLQGKIVITHIGTLYPTKGIDLLINAVKRINRSDVKLMLFEFGKETEKYKRMTGDETLWVKKRTGEKSLDYTLMADIYVIPTRDTPYTRAQTPAKIFEAMSMGRAIVASKISDMPKMLENGRAGLLAKPDDVESLSKEILRLVNDKKLRLRLGKRAKQAYIRKYHYKIQEKKLLELYERLENSLNIAAHD
jgi:glycosyltransferase involved in cell wall biosynthesis